MKSAATDGGVAPDGSPVLLYRRLPAGEEPEIIDSAIPRHSTILELGAGAGRVTHPLTARGHRVVAVDQSPEMLAWIRGVETVVGDIETLELRRRFEVVLLASHLVNTDSDEQRRAFLDTCRRHVAANGVVLVERHDPDWARTARESSVERAGIRISLTDVRRDPPFVSAVMVYEVEGRVFRQPFTARVVDDVELAEEVAQAGLTIRRHLSRTWIECVPLRTA